MKNYALLLLALLAVVFSSCDDDCFKASNNIAEVTRTIDSEFSSIEASGSFDIRVINSDLQIIILRGNDNILDMVRTDVVGDRLILDLHGTCFNNYALEMEVYTQDFSRLILEGTGDAIIESVSEQNTFSLDMSGSGDVVIAGDADLFSVVSSGSGDLEAFDLQANSVKLIKSGSGDSELRAVDLIEGSMSGSGDILYKGNPELSISQSGSGDIINAN